MNREQGFTLLEILIAIMITGLIMGTIYMFIDQAYATWERMDSGNELAQYRRVLEARLRRDLNNLVCFDLYDGVQFEGDYQRIEWLMMENENLKRVRYTVDYYNNYLLRNVVPEGDINQDEDDNVNVMNSNEGLKFFENIEFNRIEFYYYDPVDRYWKNEWSYQEYGYLPSMVRVNIILFERTSAFDNNFEIPPLIFEVFKGRQYRYKNQLKVE